MTDTWQHISIPAAKVLQRAKEEMERNERKAKKERTQCEPGVAIAAQMKEGR